MKFTFTVEVEVEREQGKFASREELQEQMEDALTSADWGTWQGENGGVYNTIGWDISEISR